jgi:hypothetical protein
MLRDPGIMQHFVYYPKEKAYTMKQLLQNGFILLSMILQRQKMGNSKTATYLWAYYFLVMVPRLTKCKTF